MADERYCRICKSKPCRHKSAREFQVTALYVRVVEYTDADSSGQDPKGNDRSTLTGENVDTNKMKNSSQGGSKNGDWKDSKNEDKNDGLSTKSSQMKAQIGSLQTEYGKEEIRQNRISTDKKGQESKWNDQSKLPRENVNTAEPEAKSQGGSKDGNGKHQNNDDKKEKDSSKRLQENSKKKSTKRDSERDEIRQNRIPTDKKRQESKLNDGSNMPRENVNTAEPKANSQGGSKNRNGKHQKNDDKKENDSSKRSQENSKKKSTKNDSEKEKQRKNKGKSTGEDGKSHESGFRREKSNVWDNLKGRYKDGFVYRTKKGTEFGCHVSHDENTKESTGSVSCKVYGSTFAAGIKSDGTSDSVYCSVGTEKLNFELNIGKNNFDFNGKFQNFGCGISLDRKTDELTAKASVNVSSPLESLDCSVGLGLSSKHGIYAEGSLNVGGFPVISLDTRESFIPKFQLPPPAALKIVCVDIVMSVVNFMKWPF